MSAIYTVQHHKADLMYTVKQLTRAKRKLIFSDCMCMQAEKRGELTRRLLSKNISPENQRRLKVLFRMNIHLSEWYQICKSF